MQTSQRDRITDALALAFSSCQFVERKEDGFNDRGVWSYVRVNSIEEFEYRIEDDWLIGSYIAVVEDDRENNGAGTLLKAYGVIERAGGEITEMSADGDSIYEAETGQKRTREMSACKIAFTLRTPNECSIC